MSLVPSKRRLSSFKLLSFDVYGTLIDWESGLFNALTSSSAIRRLPDSHELKQRRPILEAFEKQERQVQIEQPNLEYSKLLGEVFKSLCRRFELEIDDDELTHEAAKFGGSVGDWPAFPDTVAGLKRLKKHYLLVPLTNSSPATMGASNAGPLQGFEFSAIYTAADIGSYKPDLRNFEYLFSHVKEEFGVEKKDILHVAQSLHHDHEPATKIGDLENCWVDRHGLMGVVAEDSMATFGWKVNNIEELADLVEKDFA
jgi:2-haloalkanoic acid dehalogenase type II